jgi:hypothetical protein
MIIQKAQVSATGSNYSGEVTLTLVEREDGWTYKIEQVPGETFTFTWRTATAEMAARRLQDLYRGDAWDFEILEPHE